MRFRLLLVFLLMAGTAFSQDISGSLDGYYLYNFNKPASATNGLRAFDINHSSFSLNYAELVFQQKPAPVGYRFDIGFGDAAKVVNSVEPGGSHLQYLQQAYITAQKGKATVDFGKFVTPLGAEVIETKDNWNYSRGILFTWAIPFYHFGMRTTIAASDKASVGFTLTNGWNNVKDNNTAKTVGLNVTLKPGKLTFIQNYMGGKEQTGLGTRHMFDTVVQVDAHEKFSLLLNYDYGRDHVASKQVSWKGVAFYARLSPVAKYKLTPRLEWYKDENGYMTGTAQTIKSATITNQILITDALSMWLEFRRDSSDAPIFESRDTLGGKDVAGLRFYQKTFTVGLTYSFANTN